MAKSSDKKSSIKPKIQKVKAKFFKTYYSNPAKDLRIIAVTGTTGRDITAHFLHEIIKSRDAKTGLIIDPKSTSDLYKQLYDVWRSGTDHVVISVTSSALANHFFYGLPIFAAVITDSINSQNSVMNTTEDADPEAKAILFNKEPFYSILNRDDPNYELFAKYPAKTAVLSYGTSKEADLQITRTKLYRLGTEASFNFKGEKFDAATYVPGEASADYMAAAALTAFAIGLNSEIITDGIAEYEPGK